jgi:hypothetical protein
MTTLLCLSRDEMSQFACRGRGRKYAAFSIAGDAGAEEWGISPFCPRIIQG